MKLNFKVKLKPCVAGIDESNKGQVYGPVFVTAVYFNCSFNLDGSYKLPPYMGQSKKRKKININQAFKKYNLKSHSIRVSSNLIDKYNLNFLIFEAQKRLIRKIKPIGLYVDCHYGVPKKLCTDLKKFDNTLNLCVKHKLDSQNSLVGLASIISLKLKKDWLEKTEAQLNTRIGSGNLADPITKEYIKKNYPDIPFLRKKWSLRSVFR